MWRRKHNRRSSVSAACLLSSHHASRGRLAARLVSRPVLRSAPRPVLLACLICPRCLIGSLIRSPFLRRLAFFSSAHRLALASYRPAPRLIDKRNGAARTAGGGRCLVMRLTAGIGWRAAAACLPRMAIGDGGGWRTNGGGRLLLACLVAMDGAARSSLDRSSFHSSSHPIGSAPAPFIISSSHLIDGEGHSFSFSPDPLPPALLGLLAWVCSPVPGRGMRGVRHGLRRRAGRLLACVLVSRAALSLPLVRSLLYALCRSCRSFLPGASLGVLWAFLTAILSALAFLKTCP